MAFQATRARVITVDSKLGEIITVVANLVITYREVRVGPDVQGICRKQDVRKMLLRYKCRRAEA